MEIVFSRFNRPHDQQSELRIRLKIDKDDFVLINQFSSDKFKYELILPRESIISSSMFSVEEDSSPDFIKITINWGKDTYEERFDENKDIYWISEKEYIITLNQEPTVAYSPKSFVNKLHEGITYVMKRLRDTIPYNDKSCFQEVLQVKYVDSE